VIREAKFDTELDASTVSILFEPLGVIAQIIPWNFPILTMETSSSACRRKYSGAKTSRKYPISILVMELIEIFSWSS
jgi:acyl-CoA reductase-like NAD-dependent aldehyde dehydrogenase